MSKHETLVKAQEILAERGLHRGTYIDPEGSGKVCSLGALYLAAGAEIRKDDHGRDYILTASLSNEEWTEFLNAQEALRDVVKYLTNDQHSSVHEFSDDSPEHQVVRLFNIAIADTTTEG